MSDRFNLHKRKTMVKRKATESLDEWLLERRTAVQNPQLAPEIAPTPCVTAPLPTTRTTHSPVDCDPEHVATTDSTVTEEGAADWFWSLLGQAGFELW